MSDNENQLKSNVQVDDTPSASQLRLNENSSTDNVKNRVSSWLTEIVGEVRKKGVAVSVPKWVDSNSFVNTTSQNSNLRDQHNKTEKSDILIAQSVSGIELNENLNESFHGINYNNLNISNQNTCEEESEINNSSKFWNRFSFDSSNSNQNQTINLNQNEKGKVFQIKTKINEIYEKVKINKEKLPILKKSATTMDENTSTKNVISSGDEAVKLEEKNREDGEDNGSTFEDNTDSENKKDIKYKYKILNIIEDILEDPENSDKYEISNETFSNNLKENTNNSEQKQKNKENQIVPEKREDYIDTNLSFKKFERNLKLAKMGRSSTLSPKFLFDNDNDYSKYQFPANSLSKEEDQTSTESGFMSSTPNNKSKRHLAFGSIYRSFSEQQPDVIDETEELINERSHSFNVIEGENSEINNLQSEIETKNNSSESSNKKKDGTKNNISTSLPTFSAINLIQHTKSPEKKNSGNFASCGDSTSSICMDISPSGSGSAGTSTSDTRDINLRRKNTFIRDNSYQSDSSHCSSVDSLLESRKPDPETILISLGFGPIDSEDILAKIPKRFLKPSQVRGINTEAFLRRQQLMNSIHDHSVLGYRGLLGNPDLPPSVIVAKIMERFEQNEINRWNFYEYNRPQSAPPNTIGLQKFQYNT